MVPTAHRRVSPQERRFVPKSDSDLRKRGLNPLAASGCWRPRVEQLPMHGWRNEQDSVQVVNEVNLAARNQVVHRPAVRDNDHRCLGSEALSRASSALVLMGYTTRWARN